MHYIWVVFTGDVMKIDPAWMRNATGIRLKVRIKQCLLTERKPSLSVNMHLPTYLGFAGFACFASFCAVAWLDRVIQPILYMYESCSVCEISISGSFCLLTLLYLILLCVCMYLSIYQQQPCVRACVRVCVNGWMNGWMDGWMDGDR